MTALLFLKYFVIFVSVFSVLSSTFVENKAHRQVPEDFHLFSVDFLQPIVLRPIRFPYYPWLLVHSHHRVRNENEKGKIPVSRYPNVLIITNFVKENGSMKNVRRWENVSNAIRQLAYRS